MRPTARSGSRDEVAEAEHRRRHWPAYAGGGGIAGMPRRPVLRQPSSDGSSWAASLASDSRSCAVSRSSTSHGMSPTKPQPSLVGVPHRHRQRRGRPVEHEPAAVDRDMRFQAGDRVPAHPDASRVSEDADRPDVDHEVTADVDGHRRCPGRAGGRAQQPHPPDAGDADRHQLDGEGDGQLGAGRQGGAGQRQPGPEVQTSAVGTGRGPGLQLGPTGGPDGDGNRPGRQIGAGADDTGTTADIAHQRAELVDEAVPAPRGEHLAVEPDDGSQRVGEELVERDGVRPGRRCGARWQAQPDQHEQRAGGGCVAERREHAVDGAGQHGAAGIEDRVGVGEVEDGERRDVGEGDAVRLEQELRTAGVDGQAGAQRADRHSCRRRPGRRSTRASTSRRWCRS